MGTENDLYREPETDAERDVARRWGIRFYRDACDAATDSGPMTDAELTTAIAEEEEELAVTRAGLVHLARSDSWGPDRWIRNGYCIGDGYITASYDSDDFGAQPVRPRAISRTDWDTIEPKKGD